MAIAERFKIIEPLISKSSGKFGVLYKGIEKDSGKVVVIKALPKGNSENTAIERLRNEAAFSFKSPGFPEILEFHESETECILVRNYSQGITIDNYWSNLKKKERLSFLEEFMEEMNRMQRILNELNIVHCDLRPGNILIEKTDKLQVHLIDFGLAIKTIEPEKRKLLFPLGYAAPELLLNRLSLICPQTDQFSIGIVIWRLFTGKLPLTHPNPSIFTNLQLTHPLPDDSSLPKGLYSILLKMTNKHQFSLPPNKMDEREVDRLLKVAIGERYKNLNEVISDLKNLPKNFYQKISFR